MRRNSIAATAAMLAAAALVTGAPLPKLSAPAKPRRIFTHADEERMLKAQAKRARKAAQRAQAQKGQA